MIRPVAIVDERVQIDVVSFLKRLTHLGEMGVQAVAEFALLLGGRQHRVRWLVVLVHLDVADDNGDFLLA